MFALTLVESMGWVAGGAVIALLAVALVRGVKVHLYRHDLYDDRRPDDKC